MPSLALLDGEELLAEIKPHILAFWDMYVVWLWVIVLSLAFMAWGDYLSLSWGNPLAYVAGYLGRFTSGGGGQFLGRVPYFGAVMGVFNDTVGSVEELTSSYSAAGLWLTILVISSLVVSVVRIEWKWVALMVGVGLASLALTFYFDLPQESTYRFAVALSLVCVCFVELYRRSHTFYVTDRRIVTEVRFGGHKRNDIGYDKINNLVLEQGLLGSLFDFGTIIPVTASGLGMGSDYAAVTVGAAGQPQGAPTLGAAVTGGRSVQTPRVRSPYGIFGVPSPEKVQRIISERMMEYAEAPYLRKMTEQLEDLRKK